MTASNTCDEKSAFDEFDAELNLDPDERKRAQEIHNDMTALLRRAGIIDGAFLQGSFARKTMVKPLRDIDKCVLLPAGRWDELSAAGGADLVMDEIEACLMAQYDGLVAFERSRHALKVTFFEESFTFDIVPAFETDGDSDDVAIANRDTDVWQVSNTRQMIRVVQERNDATGGRFIHQVRMSKHLVRNLLDGDLPGLHVESLAHVVITEELDHAVAIEKLLSIGAQLLCGEYPEPTGRETISRKLKPDVRMRAQSCFMTAAGRAGEARRLAEAGDHGAALVIWAALFGEPFVAPAPQSAEDALAISFAGGSITSAGTVSPTQAGRQPARPARSWKER